VTDFEMMLLNWWLVGYLVVLIGAICGVIIYKRSQLRKGKDEDAVVNKEEVLLMFIAPILWPLGIIVVPYLLALLLWESGLKFICFILNKIITMGNKCC
jgi:hypothetical protein